MVAAIGADGTIINTSINIRNAANKLWVNRKKDSAKAVEIRCMSSDGVILPDDPAEDQTLVRTPLVDLIYDAYQRNTRGISHVVYGRSSIGKTTACVAFMKVAVPKLGSSGHTGVQAMMITGAPKNMPYISHMAKVLGVEKEEDVLSDLVRGMRTVKPKPASIVILDEMNSLGPDRCNIDMVDSLMRFIYQFRQGIFLLVVTQDIEVADELCKLNYWEKISPLNGLTSPSFLEVHTKVKELPENFKETATPWVEDALEWDKKMLTKFVDANFEGNGFEKDNDGNIKWLKEGMTPTNAECVAVDLLDETKRKEDKEIAFSKLI